MRNKGWLRSAVLLVLFLAATSRAEPVLTGATRQRLRDALGDSDRGVRYAASWALGKAGEGTERDIEALAALLRDSEWCVRREAARALGRLGALGIEALGAAVEDDDPDVRLAAVCFLTISGEDVRLVAPALDDGDPLVRLRAAEVCLAAEPEHREQALVSLTGLLEAADREIRWEAARRLALHGGEAALAALPVLVDGLTERKETGYGRVGEAMDLIGALVPAAADALPALLDALQKCIFTPQAVEALVRMGPRAVEAICRELRTGEYRSELVAALGAMGPAAAEAVPELIRLASVDQSFRREAAQKALGAIGPAAREAVPLLLSRLARSGHYERPILVRALARIAPEDPEVLRAIRGMLSLPDREARRAAAEVLRELPLPAHVRLAEIRDPREWVRADAAEALARGSAALPLGHLGHPVAGEDAYRAVLASDLRLPASESVLDWLDAEHPARRRLALRLLRDRGDPHAGRVVGLLQDPDPGVRALAARLLAGRPEGVPGTLALLDDEDPVVREAAVRALKPTPAHVNRDFARLLREGSVRTRILVARVLRDRGAMSLKLVPDLVEALGDPSPAMRSMACQALAANGARGGFVGRGLAGLLADEDRGVRVQAAIALSSQGPGAVPYLLDALADESWRVRRHAVRSLGALGGAAGPAAPRLVDLLADEWLMVGLEARDALARIGAPAARPLAESLGETHYGRLHHARTVFEGLGPEGAEAVPALVALLDHEDQNVREISVRALGEIGPGAGAAIPDLARLLRAPRISLRSCAAVSLGRVGPAVLPTAISLLEAEDARVRAHAAWVVGWLIGEESGFDQVPAEIRLPMEEPGPAAETGFVPTPEQIEQARSLLGGRSEAEVRERLFALPEEERVPALRAGLRQGDIRIATASAVAAGIGLDAWEMERMAELILPELFRRESLADTGWAHGYLASNEAAPLLRYASGSGVADQRRLRAVWQMREVATAGLLSEIYRIERSGESAVLDGTREWGNIRSFSDRCREEAARLLAGTAVPEPADVESDLPPLLRALLRKDGALPRWVLAWLNDSEPADGDEEILLAAARRLRAETEPLAVSNLEAVLRALGKIDGHASERFLLGFFARNDSAGRFARAALARRGDPDALRRLVEESVQGGWGPEDEPMARRVHDPLALALLFEAAPDFAADLYLSRLLAEEGEGAAGAFQPRSLADRRLGVTWLDPDFEVLGQLARRHGIRLPDTVFLPVEDAVLRAGVPAHRLAWIALAVPACRTRRLAERIVSALGEGVPPEWSAEDGPSWPELSELLPFLDVADPEGFRALLRTWSRSEDDRTREYGLRLLLHLGDEASASRLIEYVDGLDELDEFDDPPLYLLARTRAREVREHLEKLARGDDEARGRTALYALAILHGLPETLIDTLHFEHFTFEKPVTPDWYAELREAILDGRPAEGYLAAFGDPAVRWRGEWELGLVPHAGARELLRSLKERRDLAEYPHVMLALARQGDPAARAEVWSAVRCGRYLWYEYQCEYELTTLGWAPQTYPFWVGSLETNASRGSNARGLFEDLLGWKAFGERWPDGQDNTPHRNAISWLRLHGGRFVQSRLATYAPHLVPAAE